MVSNGSGRAYRIYVRTPAMPPPTGGYPVLFFTDGNITFPIAAVLSQLIEWTSNCGPSLIVGIGYPVSDLAEADFLRSKDLTSEGPGERFLEALPEQLRHDAYAYGGADQFFHFLTEELSAVLASIYPISAENRALCGQSLGGLFALSTLFRHPGAFRTFVAGSPAIWWNDKSILREFASFRSMVEAAQAAPRVLITVGSLEQSADGLPTPPQMTREGFEELLRRERWVDNAVEFASDLAAIQGPAGYLVECHVAEGETHGSMAGATVSKALRFALSR